MDNPRFLSGEELVAKGLTKVEASLPEIGLKDVIPNGSWLEQKQIQSALDARRQLIEVERIEKIGQLSQAEWRDDLKLAEVMKKSGPHWQFLGHNVGKHLFLRPEEALFLMESNCLLLKHSDVIVSLQKAYSLLLGHTTSHAQYKVYASLSRLGYRIIRHTESNFTKNIEKGEVNHVINQEIPDLCNDCTVKDDNQPNISDVDQNDVKSVNINDSTIKSVKNSDNIIEKNCSMDEEMTVIVKEKINETNRNLNEKDVGSISDNMEIENDANKKASSGAVSDVQSTQMCIETENCTTNRVNKANFTIDEGGVIRFLNKTQEEIELELSKTLKQNSDLTAIKNAKSKPAKIPISIYQQKLQKLKNRNYKPLDHKLVEENFNLIPNIYRQSEVTINVPDEKLLPRNVFLNNTTYVLNVDQVRNKITRSSSTPTNEPSSSTNIVRIGGSFTSSSRGTDTPQFTNNTFRQEFPRQFSPFATWRPRVQCNFYYPYNNMYIPRPFSTLPNFYVHHRYRYQGTPFVNTNQPSVSNVNYIRPNTRQLGNSNRGPIRLNKLQFQIKMTSLKTLQNLVERHKHLAPLVPNITPDSLIKLIGHYNLKYNERLRLTNNFELINDVQPVEVIELHDDEGTKCKRRRLNEEGNAFDRNTNAIKELASKLRELDSKKLCASRHRRALSNVIKKFNKSFNADIYLNKDYEIIDRRFVTLDSSSDSDSNKKNKRKRKLRNPFNILKRINDKAGKAGSSRDVEMMAIEDQTKETLSQYFDKNWLPDNNDFGRPEICTNNHTNSRIIDSREDGLVYEFLKESRESYKNWTDLKMSFYENLEASTITIENQQIDVMSRDFMMDFECKVKPILIPEDCTDMHTVLEKLRIIKTNKGISNETNLRIDFDVYNRNVQNFKKTNLPKPHFRIICLEESSNLPPTSEIGCLLSKYDDNIPLVFAIVGFGSISYMRINPIDLDIYIPNDLG